jgi:DNA-binding transcriptional MerR regulator
MATTTYTISDLAKEFDLTTRAMRFYEDMGLLQPERSGPGGRNRVYSARDRTRLKLTLRGKRLGLSLSEILQLVRMYDSEADTAPQLQAFMSVLRSHREQLEQQQDDIRVMLVEIGQHEQRCKRLMANVTRTAARR